MSTEMWSQLDKLSDGDSLNAETLNVPIGQLGERTAYLYRRLKELMAGGTMSAVILTGASLSTETGKEPAVGNVVYLDRKTGTFAKAVAKMSLYDDFTAADSAFTVGILQTKSGTVGNVLVYGRLSMNPVGMPFEKDAMIESGETFRPGRYYLSANEAGKLTAHPNGPLIYVCSIDGTLSGGLFNGMAVVNPQFLDIGTSHTHRAAVLTALPAGTKSTAGYLPVDETYTSAQVGPLALKFGGTWTASNPIDYAFRVGDAAQSMAAWPNGVVLYWTEDGGEEKHVTIHAPDEVVSLSNGLTVQLALPASTNTLAYSGLSQNQRTWSALTFPFAGRGWIDHVPMTTISGTTGFKVAVRGKLYGPPNAVNVAFPALTQILEVGTIEDGTEFTYGSVTYEFTTDTETYEGENTPLPLGTNLEDSTRYLAKALNEQENGSFAVFGYDEGVHAKLLAMDGSTITADGSLFVSKTEETGASFDIVGASGVKSVVFDGDFTIVSSTAMVKGISSYQWKSCGDISLMIYQYGNPGAVAAGTIVSGILEDDEPDAAYDYVIGMDPQIANFWPPIPPKSAALIVNGVEMDNKALIPEHPTVSFGRTTLHWFSDAAGKKPWPDAFVERGIAIDPSLDKTEVLHWVRGFQCATGPVTSIQVKSGSPLKIVGYGTEDAANTGDLEIAADFDFDVVNGGAPGYLVPKRARKGKLIAGPVVERIIGGAGVSIITKAGCPAGQGTVIVSLENGAYSSQFSDVALENAEQAKIGMFPYVRLKGYSGSSISQPSAFTATMRVPTNLPDGTYSLRVFAAIFGENGFTGVSKQSACVKFAYNILPDYSALGDMRYRNLKTSLLKPDNERTVLIPFGHTSGTGIVYNGFDPIYMTTDDDGLVDRDDVIAKVLGKSIPYVLDFSEQTVIPELKPGYLVGIRFSRAITEAEGVVPYTGPLGIINLSWSLTATDDYGTAKYSSEDLYAKNAGTGLFHKVVAVTDATTKEVNLGVEQTGIAR